MSRVLIVGPSCSICDNTHKRVDRVIRSRSLDCAVERVIDVETIFEHGVYAIPGLIIDGVLKSVGRVPEEAELVYWLDPDPD